MRERELLWAVIITFFLTVSSASPAEAQIKDSAQVTTSYSFVTERVSLHEPVILVFHIFNQSSQTIKLELGAGRKAAFVFSVTPPNGANRTLPRLFPYGMSAPGTFLLQPGESYSQNLVLDEWYEFSAQGKYEIQGHLDRPMLFENGIGSVTDPGFDESIEVGPLDELQLNKVCDAYANAIETSSSYGEASQAAFELSYVKDPISVPYLRRALFSGKPIESITIAGLVRVGNEAAVNVLVEGLRSESSDIRMLSKAALINIQTHTNDSNVRQRVGQLLEPSSK